MLVLGAGCWVLGAGCWVLGRELGRVLGPSYGAGPGAGPELRCWAGAPIYPIEASSHPAPCPRKGPTAAPRYQGSLSPARRVLGPFSGPSRHANEPQDPELVGTRLAFPPPGPALARVLPSWSRGPLARFLPSWSRGLHTPPGSSGLRGPPAPSLKTGSVEVFSVPGVRTSSVGCAERPTSSSRPWATPHGST